MQEKFKQDLATLQVEIEKLGNELNKVEIQRNSLVQRMQQLTGAAAYLRGQLPEEEIPNVDNTEEIAEEKPEETTQENSEG